MASSPSSGITGPPPPYSPQPPHDTSPSASSRLHNLDRPIDSARYPLNDGATGADTERTPLLPNIPTRPPSQTDPKYKLSTPLCVFISLFAIVFASLIWLVWSNPPQPALPTWINIIASPVCTSVGSRMYTGQSSYMPEGFHPETRCAEMPISIHNRLISNPYECWSETFEREISTVEGERRNVTYTITRGKWLVNWNESGCVPVWEGAPRPDAQCQANHRDRGYTSFLTVSRIPPGLDPLDACRNTRTSIHGRKVPVRDCQLFKQRGVEVVRGRSFIEDPSCTPAWVDITAAPGCSSIGARMYTATSSHMPLGFHPDPHCSTRPITIHGRVLPEPISCHSETVEREVLDVDTGTPRRVAQTLTTGKWLVDFGEPGCIPTWEGRPIPDAQCQANHRDRGYTSFLTVSRIPPGLNPLDVCRNTRATIHGRMVSTRDCQLLEQSGIEVIRGRFIIEDPSCTPVWVNITALPECSSIGERMYTAFSSHMPLGYHPDPHCSTRPITIHGRVFPRPNSCKSEAVEREISDGGTGAPLRVVQTLTTGKWLVDFDEPSCIPTWDSAPTPDERCSSYGSRGYTASMSLSRVPPGLDPLKSCRNTWATVNHRQSLPTECQLDHEHSVVRARFAGQAESSCATAYWTDVQPDYQCTEYGLKKYTGVLRDVPQGLDGVEVCKQVRYMFFGIQAKNLLPDECEVDEEKSVKGSWMIDFHVPECHPVLKDVQDKGCVGTNIKRAEGWLDDIGRHEDWYRLYSNPMPSTSKQLVFLVGATGRTGISIARGLSKRPDEFTVKALVRPASIDKPIVQELKSLGVEVIPGDISQDSQETLEAHLKGVDTVISTTVPIQDGDQTKLLLAAKSTGVKRVVPSDFGAYAPLGVMEYHDTKLKTQQSIIDNDIPYTFIYVGGWPSGLMPLPHSEEGDTLTNIYRKQFFGSGKVKVSWTGLERVGDFVARIISDPRTLNQTVQTWDGEATVEEEEDVESRMSQGVGTLESYVYAACHSLYFRGDSAVAKAVAAGALDARVLYPDYIPLSLEEFAKDHYRNPEKL
ncbi:hypothetical protein V5O48_016587 [Marasmius crinis-equi]|uniref:NmrA-like domain-containing protein n=1 Tax=Marasmius crinis-equi TaxID=585013 RepID=A0ABR3ERF6_9AGAR